MAFLTCSDIQADLTAGYNPKRVTRMLRRIEELLLVNNVTFADVAVESRKIFGDYSNLQSIFDIKPFQAVTSLKIKTLNGSEQLLTLNEDYKLVKNDTWTEVAGADVFYRIELLEGYAVKSPDEYLEVNATWGIKTGLTCPQLLQDAIIDFIDKYEGYMISTGGGSNVGQIKKATIDNSTVEYETNAKSNYDTSITSNPADDEQLMSVIYKYAII